MKKNICVFLALALISVLPGCSSPAAGKQIVNVYNWGEYIDDDVLKMFEEETGITVNYRTFEHNEALYSTLKGGGADYDVIIPSDYMVSRLISEGMLEPINLDSISNFDKLDPSYLDMEFDPGNKYSIPYTWGTVGIIYNTEMVDEEISGWGALFDEKYKGQILMFDNSRDAMGIALKYLGYSFNTTDESELRQAAALLQEQKPLVQAYVMDQIFDKLIGDEAALGPYYAGDAITMIEENPSLAYCAPEEGANIFVDSMCIPKGAENKDNAEKFIDFMCRTDITLLNSEATGYGTPSAEAYDQLDEDTKSDELLYPPESVLGKAESFINLPQNILNLYDELWVNIKAS